MEGSVAGSEDRAWVRRIAALVISVGAFAGSLFLNVRHNTFPYGYHPDEPSKARQILSPVGFRNFLHPQLLLEVTQRALNWSGATRDIQGVTELGRWVSAVFAAVGVAAICVTGYLEGGAWGAILLGASSTFCSSLIVAGHYFKEDTSLIMGMCLVVAATHCMMSVGPGARARAIIIFLGLACAVAASAKYVGVVFLIVGLVALMATPARSRRMKIARALGLMAAFAFFFGVINYRALIDFHDFRLGFDSEAKHAVTEHFGVTMNRPNSYFIDNLPSEAGWAMVIFGGMAIVVFLLTKRRRSKWDALMISIGPGYLVMLSFSSLPAVRYLLPTVMMLHITAGLSALWVIELATTRAKRVVGGIALAAIFMTVGLPRCLSVVHQFGDDSRDRLRGWLIANVPPGKVVVGDFYTGMVIHAENMAGDDTIGNRIAVREVYDVSSLGPISSLRGNGVSYVAVSDRLYNHYFVPQFRATPEFKRQFDERRQWFVDLFANHAPVWQYDPPMNLHGSTNPAIRLYQIEN